MQSSVFTAQKGPCDINILNSLERRQTMRFLLVHNHLEVSDSSTVQKHSYFSEVFKRSFKGISHVIFFGDISSIVSSYFRSSELLNALLAILIVQVNQSDSCSFCNHESGWFKSQSWAASCDKYD